MRTDPAFERLAGSVASAREALVGVARTRPGEWWSASDLRRQAQNGFAAAEVSLALEQLVDAGVLEVNDSLRVRLPA